jgi:hypothetical protein
MQYCMNFAAMPDPGCSALATTVQVFGLQACCCILRCGPWLLNKEIVVLSDMAVQQSTVF